MTEETEKIAEKIDIHRGLKGVVPEWDLKDIYAGMAQFKVLQVIGLLLVLVFPQLALWLPAVLRD